MRGITPAVKYLLIINIAIYLIDGWFGEVIRPFLNGQTLRDVFALQADWMDRLSFGQLFTYMFVHSPKISHILMNMLSLFFIGPTVERTLGSYRFFILYYLSGILGGLGWSLLAQDGQSCVGASGAVMGILGAFAALYPNAKVVLLFFPFFPIKVWKLVLAFALFEFFQTFIHPVFGGIASAAHLMGGIAGFAYAFSLKHPHVIQKLKNKLLTRGTSNPKASRSTAKNETLSKDEIDHILDKIGKQGMGALTPRERDLLKKATR